MEKILTIVVPTYNAEAYLRDNLESFCIPELLSQLEVLIINDGSTDHSAEIAEEYQKKYPDTYRLITKENGGHGSGINCGIEHASGCYFKVVDADDWVERESFIHLMQTLSHSRSDLVYSGFYWVYDNGQKNKDDFARKAEMKIPFEGVEYQKEYRFEDISDHLYIKMHSMTIRTEILKSHEIHIDEHCYYVDTEYITYPIPYVETITFVEDFVYMYRLGRQGQSVSMEKMQKNEKNYDHVLRSLLQFYDRLGVDIPCSKKKKEYIARIIARAVAGKVRIMLSFPPSKQKKTTIKLFDEELKKHHSAVYNSNVNRPLKLLRSTQYLLYMPASMLVRWKYR